MPKLYEYFGLDVLFYSNDHLPIHVHGRVQNRAYKAEILISDGIITDIKFVPIKGKLELSPTELEKFKNLVHIFKEEIVQKWIQFFVFNKPIKPEKITKKIK